MRNQWRYKRCDNTKDTLSLNIGNPVTRIGQKVGDSIGQSFHSVQSGNGVGAAATYDLQGKIQLVRRTEKELVGKMNREELMASIAEEAPPAELSAPLAALWWDAKGDWTRAHAMVDELETGDGMAVHAYLHRKEGDATNADYWYRRAGRGFQRPSLDDEWVALVDGLLGSWPPPELG